MMHYDPPIACGEMGDRVMQYKVGVMQSIEEVGVMQYDGSWGGEGDAMQWGGCNTEDGRACHCTCITN